MYRQEDEDDYSEIDNDISIDENDEKLNSLLTEFSSVRDDIKKMITELEEITTTVKQLFPEKFDARYRMIFQERIKAVTELFKILLDMRKEITKNIKDEIDLRRKVKSSDKIENLDGLLNMSAIMDKIEQFETKTKKTKEKFDENPLIEEMRE